MASPLSAGVLHPFSPWLSFHPRNSMSKRQPRRTILTNVGCAAKFEDASSDSDSGGAVDWDSDFQQVRQKRLKGEALDLTSQKFPRTVETGNQVEGADHTEDDVGPRLTKWGGNVRGGKYRLGEGADRQLELWGNGDAMLYAAVAIIILIFVLLPFRPGARM